MTNTAAAPMTKMPKATLPIVAALPHELAVLLATLIMANLPFWPPMLTA